MNLSKLFLIYWGICTVISFIIEWNGLRKSNLPHRNYVGYLITMAAIGFVIVPFTLTDYFITNKTKDWHDE